MALCTLSDLKSWLGIDALDTSKDTILTMIINSVSKKYENYCTNNDPFCFNIFHVSLPKDASNE